MGIATLRDFARAEPSGVVMVQFDGRVLAFEAPGLTCVMPAEGGLADVRRSGSMASRDSPGGWRPS